MVHKKNRRLFSATTNRLGIIYIPKCRQFVGDYVTKFGDIWCYPRLAVPEKLPKNSQKSGVCLRGYKMMSFWPKKKRITVPDRGELCASDSKKLQLVYFSDRAEVTSQRCAKWAFCTANTFDCKSIGRRFGSHVVTNFCISPPAFLLWADTMHRDFPLMAVRKMIFFYFDLDWKN